MHTFSHGTVACVLFAKSMRHSTPAVIAVVAFVVGHRRFSTHTGWLSLHFIEHQCFAKVAFLGLDRLHNRL